MVNKSVRKSKNGTILFAEFLNNLVYAILFDEAHAVGMNIANSLKNPEEGKSNDSFTMVHTIDQSLEELRPCDT